VDLKYPRECEVLVTTRVSTERERWIDLRPGAENPQTPSRVCGVELADEADNGRHLASAHPDIWRTLHVLVDARVRRLGSREQGDRSADDRVRSGPEPVRPELSRANAIHLDEAAIESALPLAAAGLKKYCWLQAALATTDVAHDREFQIRFNAFYRVRRSPTWQSAFYGLLQQNKSKLQSFADVLRALHAATGRAEASFTSKLVASVDPDMPVIDAFVLKNVGLRLPRPGPIETRLARMVELHDLIRRTFSDYLAGDLGRHLVARFEESYPDRHITRVKMLDLILWQAR
jgi:hypothetical protein